MGILDLLRAPDINRGVREYADTPDAVLLDVRAAEEFREGHIPGSRNVPLHELDDKLDVIGNRSTPVFVYCYSGARSRRAASTLQDMGYTRVRNLGGIAAYSGKVDRLA